MDEGDAWEDAGEAVKIRLHTDSFDEALLKAEVAQLKNTAKDFLKDLVSSSDAAILETQVVW